MQQQQNRNHINSSITCKGRVRTKSSYQKITIPINAKLKQRKFSESESLNFLRVDLHVLCNTFTYIYFANSCLSLRSSLNSTWRAGVGPAKDLYYIGDNPQYRLTTGSEGAPVWALLTRHITDKVS